MADIKRVCSAVCASAQQWHVIASSSMEDGTHPVGDVDQASVTVLLEVVVEQANAGAAAGQKA